MAETSTLLGLGRSSHADLPVAPSSADLTTEADNPIQFEHAEYVTAWGFVCSLCQQPIEARYFQLNDNAICDDCRHDVLRTVCTDSHAARLSRLLRAFFAGTVAALGGAILYFAVVKLTGYEIGLIAIAVGLAVGHAVRWGCHGRGGAPYQTIAVALTYLAIVATYVPFIVAAVRAAPPATSASVSATTSNGPSGDERRAETAPSLRDLVTALAFLMAFAMAAPFLGGFQNIIGLAIIGFALFEAWKVNRRVPINITGPYAITVAPHPST